MIILSSVTPRFFPSFRLEAITPPNGTYRHPSWELYPNRSAGLHSSRNRCESTNGSETVMQCVMLEPSWKSSTSYLPPPGYRGAGAGNSQVSALRTGRPGTLKGAWSSLGACKIHSRRNLAYHQASKPLAYQRPCSFAASICFLGPYSLCHLYKHTPDATSCRSMSQ